MISAKVTTKFTPSSAYEEFKKNFGKGGAYVTVGVHEGAGSYPNGVSVAEVALWNEFGTEKIPERSFLRSALYENLSKIEAMRTKVVQNMIEKGWTTERALSVLGLFAQNLVQNKIKSNVPPVYGTGKGNSPDKVKELQEAKKNRVGHYRTLRETDLLLRSITFQVHLDD